MFQWPPPALWMSLCSIAWIPGSSWCGLYPHSQLVPPGISGPWLFIVSSTFLRAVLRAVSLSEKPSTPSSSGKSNWSFRSHPKLHLCERNFTLSDQRGLPLQYPVMAWNSSWSIFHSCNLLICSHLMPAFPIRQKDRPVSLSAHHCTISAQHSTWHMMDTQ